MKNKDNPHGIEIKKTFNELQDFYFLVKKKIFFFMKNKYKSKMNFNQVMLENREIGINNCFFTKKLFGDLFFLLHKI